MIYTAARIILELSLFISLGLAVLIFSPPISLRLSAAIDLNRWLEYFCQIICCAILACLTILLAALLKSDMNLAYVAGKVGPALPIQFRISALWAGAEGSLLCWTAAVALAGVIFQACRAYAELPGAGALYFWGFFYLILTFFLFLICAFSQPFLETETVKIAGIGSGMNPILRHPAMIIHPPLIFLGYAALCIPAALGLSRLAVGPTGTPAMPCHPADSLAMRRWLASAWALCGAGIVLGMWWAYSESGWGGYWTWDPVENTSLLSWLAASAAIHSHHSGLLKRSFLFRLNGLLAVLPLAACLFATFVVRSGILISKHSYSSSGPNLSGQGITILGFTALLILMGLIGVSGVWQRFRNGLPKFPSRLNLERNLPGIPRTNPPMDNAFSQNNPERKHYGQTGHNGFWQTLSYEKLFPLQLFLIFSIALAISIGTFWPWLTEVFGPYSLRLDNSFFITACMPLTGLWLLCAIAAPPQPDPYGSACNSGWTTQEMLLLGGKLAGILLSCALIHLCFPTIPVSLELAFLGLCCVTVAVSLVRLLSPSPRIHPYSPRRPWSELGPARISNFCAHTGLALLLLGVGLSSLLKQEWEVTVSPEHSVSANGIRLTFQSLNFGNDEQNDFALAHLRLKIEAGGNVRIATLEQRAYNGAGTKVAVGSTDGPNSTGSMGGGNVSDGQKRLAGTISAKTSFLHGLRHDVGFTLLQLSMDKSALIRVTDSPFVNLIWLGGILMTLSIFPAWLHRRNTCEQRQFLASKRVTAARPQESAHPLKSDETLTKIE